MKIFDYSELSTTQKLIFHKMKEHNFDLGSISLAQMAEKCQCSENTILSLCRKMGFKGYKDFKLETSLNPEYRTTLYYSDVVSKNEDFSTLIDWQNRALSSLNQLFSTMSMSAYLEQASRILQAQEIIIFGHNVSAIPSQFLSHRLNLLHLKTTACQLGTGNDLRFRIARLGEKDMIIIFTFKPYYYRIAKIVNLAEKSHIPILSITDSYESLASISPETTIIAKTDVPFFDNSLLSPIAVCEILSTLIAVEMGEQAIQAIKENGAINEFLAGNNLLN